MRRGHSLRCLAVAVFVAVACAGAVAAPPAAALNLKPVCTVAGALSTMVGKACGAVQNGGRLIGATRKLLGGHVAGAVKALVNSGAPATATRRIGTAAVGLWAVLGARFALRQTATLLAATVSPQLRSAWFSATYWRMEGIGAVLTLPFLFAAAIQALMRSDVALLIRAAFGYLPLALLAVGVAAPLTMLMLAAADELSHIVATASGNDGGHVLIRAASATASLTAASVSPFVGFVVGVFTVAGALVLWTELLMREAAVYVIVLMLPLAFAALVWPARRGWAIRAVEVLVALIFSKFAIVAVLSLGGAAMNASLNRISPASWLAGFVLIMLGVFAPWALLRVIPLAELAAGVAGSLRSEALRSARTAAETAGAAGHLSHDWARTTTARMRRDAGETPSRAPMETASRPPAREASGAPAGSDAAAAEALGARRSATAEPMPRTGEPPPPTGELAPPTGGSAPPTREPTPPTGEPSAGTPGSSIDATNPSLDEEAGAAVRRAFPGAVVQSSSPLVLGPTIGERVGQSPGVRNARGAPPDSPAPTPDPPAPTPDPPALTPDPPAPTPHPPVPADRGPQPARQSEKAPL